MNITKILAGLLIAVAIGLAIMAWMLGRQPQRNVAPPVPASAAIMPSASPTPPPQQASVVVASRPIAAGQRIHEEDVTLQPVATAVSGSFPKTEAVVGRTTLTAIHPDTAISEQQLINGLALQVDVGQRAVSIAVKENMAAGHHIRPGDFVDVFFTLDGKNDAVAVETQTRLLLARSRVLAYGSSSVDNPPLTAAQKKALQDQDSSASRRGSQDTSSRPETAQTALLAIPLEDVQRLALAEKYGQLTLALRHPDDLSVPDPALFAVLPSALQPVAGRLAKGEKLQAVDQSFAGMRLKDLASGAENKNIKRNATPPLSYATARPAPAARPHHSVEVHQGTAVQTVSY